MASKRKARPVSSAQLAVNTARLDRIEPVLEQISARLGAIEQSLARNKGFWGAVTLIGGAITTFLVTFKDSILSIIRQ